MIGQPATGNAEHPGPHRTLITAKAFQVLGKCQPCLSRQIVGSRWLLPTQVTEDGRVEAVEDQCRGPLLTCLGGG